LAKRELKVPFVAAGGICDSRGFLGCLATGADGIMMGTAFIATKECPVSTHVKQAIASFDSYSPELRHLVLDPPDPEAYKAIMSLRDKMPFREWLMALERVNLKDPNWQVGSHRKSVQELRVISLSAALIDRVVTVQELIDGIVRGAEEMLHVYQFFRSG